MLRSPRLKSVNLYVFDYDVFTADILRHAVTLTSEPLIS